MPRSETMEGIDVLENHNKCQQTRIIIRKSFTYISCLVCMVLIAIYGIKGIFHELTISLLFLFFFAVYLVNFFYFDILLLKNNKVILIDDDIENPTLFGFPIHSNLYSLRHQQTDEGYHGSLDHPMDGGIQASRRNESITTSANDLRNSQAPPSYQEVMAQSAGTTLASSTQECSIRCETPPPSFEHVKASSSWVE